MFDLPVRRHRGQTQTAVDHYVHPNGHHIMLVGTAHIGTRYYYAALLDMADELERRGFDLSELPGVWAQMCETCIFRPGNPMHLRPGALKDVVDKNLAHGTLLICHKTTFGQMPEQIVCRGFYDKYGPQQQVYQVIQRLGGFREVQLDERTSDY